MHNIFLVSLLYPHLYGGNQKSTTNAIALGDNQEYEIDRIMSHKKTRGRTMYQVRWRGYNTMKNSWLREEDLANALDLLKAY